MPDELEAYIIQQNIELYRRRLEATMDEDQRRMLAKLLAEEREKQKRLSTLPWNRPSPRLGGRSNSSGA